MKGFSITELARIIKTSPSRAANHELLISSISTDSRTIMPGDCFFAITGEKFDGHDYIRNAFAEGAACAVVGSDRIVDCAGKIVLKVDDTRKALGRLAREYRRQCGFKVVAITGSTGKTTTRQIIYHVLSRRYRVVQSPKNFNNDIGLPLSLLSAEPQDEIAVVELGTNCIGEIGDLTAIALPDIAVVTNVYPAHLAGFGSVEMIAREKLSIADGLQSGGVLIINGDFDLLVEECRNKGVPFTTFGKSAGCDVNAKDIAADGLAGRFTLDGVRIYLPLPGPGNIENAIAAWAVCRRFGISIDDFARDVKTLSAVSMRAEPMQIGTLTVLNDCYNANPGSMKNALATLAGLDSTGNRRLVFICGDMAELGPQSLRLHAELGGLIAKTGVRVLLTVGELAKTAAQAAVKNAEYDLQTAAFGDTVSMCKCLEKFIKDSDIILVKGSRAVGLEKTVEKLKELFS